MRFFLYMHEGGNPGEGGNRGGGAANVKSPARRATGRPRTRRTRAGRERPPVGRRAPVPPGTRGWRPTEGSTANT
jgi:hypothetical protein